jgi:cystathionine beta-lyase family protein involved in aluminum resistance
VSWEQIGASWGLSEKTLQLAKKAEQDISSECQEYDKLGRANHLKVLRACQDFGLGAHHFAGSTGYGYADMGREALEGIFSSFFGTQASLVRPQIASGTQAISSALFGLLRPGDQLLSITGAPYDTLRTVIGTEGEAQGTLKEWGISYGEVPLLEDKPDLEAIAQAIGPKTRVVAIQRSRGYSTRPAFTIEQIQQMVDAVRSVSRDSIIFCDNCYGEFVEESEPTGVGVDVIAGSLIKNPGGALAPYGGYLAGKEELIERIASHITAPGLGRNVGASGGLARILLQGFFQGPLVVAEALSGAAFVTRLFELAGFRVFPSSEQKRGDIVAAIELGSPQRLEAFCKAIQKASPVDSNITPIPAPMAGYTQQVIMAGGTFIDGSSIELSADGPLSPPYIAYLQGGICRSHVQIASCLALEAVAKIN